MNRAPVQTSLASSVDHSSASQADRWLEIFSIFIHDLESPITSVKYLLNLLEKNKFDPSRQSHQVILNSSKVALDRAESILFDIMAVARSGELGLPVNMKTIVPTAVIEESIALVQGSLAERGIKINLTNNIGEIPVKADPKLLKRVLDNLLYNAIRHTPDNGEIALYTEPGKDAIFIHVKDSGPGLGEIDPDELFEKYGQVKLRQEGKHRGVGLGLYFCRLVVTGMGGTIIADDHEKGGAVFSVMLKKGEQ